MWNLQAPSIDRSVTAKWWEIDQALKIRSKNFGAPEKMLGAKIQKLAQI